MLGSGMNAQMADLRVVRGRLGRMGMRESRKSIDVSRRFGDAPHTEECGRKRNKTTPKRPEKNHGKTYCGNILSPRDKLCSSFRFLEKGE